VDTGTLPTEASNLHRGKTGSSSPHITCVSLIASWVACTEPCFHIPRDSTTSWSPDTNFESAFIAEISSSMTEDFSQPRVSYLPSVVKFQSHIDCSQVEMKHLPSFFTPPMPKFMEMFQIGTSLSPQTLALIDNEHLTLMPRYCHASSHG
jgi:hypothetical protein